MTVSFILNGKKIKAEAGADESLLKLLRGLGVCSVRSGCETSNCGICTVWVDGVPTLSCSYPAPRIEGHKVTTVEGAGDGAEEFMELLAEEGADQCGYCSPGMIMTVMALVRDFTDPTDDEIRAYLSGNLCRCTGYQSQMRAIRKLLERRREQNG